MKKYKYLFCDLDGTLIKTASGQTFAEDATDFRIRKDVLDKIKESLHHENDLEFIAIVTNQGGIPQYISERDFVAKLKAIETFAEEYISIPVMSYYCASLDPNDEDRKPNVGMLAKAARDCTTILGWKFDSKKALMIGDASGKAGQFSDSDKKTAENFGIDYMDVEDFVKLHHEDA